MLQKIRRIVTGHNAAGKAVILFNDHAPNATPIKGWSLFANWQMAWVPWSIGRPCSIDICWFLLRSQ